MEGYPIFQVGADELAHADIEADNILGLIMDLPDQQRDALLLEIMGETEAEKAETLGTARGTIKSHLTRARARLRGRLVETANKEDRKIPVREGIKGDLREGIAVMFAHRGKEDEDEDERMLEQRYTRSHPLLEVKQQQILFHHLRTHGHGKDDLFFDPEFLSPDERDNTLWHYVYKQSADILDILINCNKGLLFKTTRKFMAQPASRDIRLTVLLSAAELGMRDATNRFDPSFEKEGKPIAFSTYALPNVEFFLSAAIQEEQGITNAEHTLINLHSFVRYAFFQEKGRDPTEVEMYELLLYHANLTVKMTDRIINFFKKHKMLSRPELSTSYSGANIDTLPTVLPAEGADHDEQSLQRDAITASLGLRSELEQNIIRDRFGLNPTGTELTIKELALKYGLSELQIDTLITESLDALASAHALAPLARGRIQRTHAESVDEALYERALAGDGMTIRERVKVLSPKMLIRDIVTLCGITRQWVNALQNDLMEKGELRNPL
jgi:DNA-directed RNA polymerase specialized sigma subunit